MEIKIVLCKDRQCIKFAVVRFVSFVSFELVGVLQIFTQDGINEMGVRFFQLKIK